ncbi:helix-turn-helix domain-containing protein [Actinoallomurus sp. NBC_01490]|uniref:ArsR family transcriptional regulator n=1 Tax=Actinoallomurus sp. NBC_01490 TaxID=2903557 RepID=UPI002E2F6377|nr:ArsR family transcriptional regulator [Actinoallomurus sp. NBC_01490]
MADDDAGAEPGLAERLARLEERVAALESANAAPVSTPDAGSDRFWALDGLKERIPDPGAVLFVGSVTLPTGEHYSWQEGLATGAILDSDWTDAGTTLAALAHPIRLLLLREILGGARTTAELGNHEQLGTTGQLYHHLRQLVSAGWLRSTTRGQYTVPPERVIPLLVILTICHR